jgi:uncharacterized membrane protein YccC
MKPTPQRLAALLDLVMTTEHVYLEVERLAVLADEPISDELRQQHGTDIESALKVLDSAFAEQINHVLAGLPAIEERAQRVPDLSVMIHHLSALSVQTSSVADESATPETLNFVGFVRGLEAIANLLEPREHPLAHASAEPIEVDNDLEPRPFIDPAKLRFSIKLGYYHIGSVGRTTQRADLQTILWSIAVAGQPNQYGAVVRKTILRLVGCIVGSLAALTAMLIVSQNFDSLRRTWWRYSL